MVRYVTEIRDAFNNRVEFSYFAAPGPVDGVSQIRQYLGGGQVREINFTYDAALKGLASMTYGTKTWTYTQNAAGPPGFNVLRTVQPPVGVPTTYDYSGSAPGHELTVVHAPGGGTITYTYTDVVQVSGAVTTTGRGVATKTLGGSYVTPGTWTYTYGTGGNHDTTRIVCPCGTTTYRFNGIGNSGNFTGWLAGTIAEQTVEDASGVLEREEFTWIPSEAISTDPTIGSGGVWSDADVFKPLLQVHTTKRGTYTWTTTSEYHTGLGNFNDYGRPWRIFQDGELHRVIARTFQYGFGPYIVDRVSREEVTVGGQSFERNWVYTLSTGFLEKEALGHINLGTVTTYTPTGDGNVAWLNDPRGYVTSFAYSWGRVQQVTTPHLTKTHAINPDGTVASETVGGLTTTYEYDDAFRLLRMKPPGNTEWLTYEYDNLFAGYLIEQRLPAWTTTRFDGFGRVRNTLDQAGVKSWIERDACGRTTHASLPYTAGPGNVFTVTTYDGLSRPLTTTLGSAVTSYSYPGASVIVTTPENRQTNYEYKAFGSPADRVLSVVKDADNKFTSYGYDVFGNLTRVNGPNATGALGTLPERTWAYDARNRLVSETQPERGTTTYTYDNAGNLLTTLDANNVTTTLTYDGNSRLIKREMTGNVDNVELSYNALGQLVTMANPSLAFPNMSTAFEYEPATGRLKKRTDLVTGQTFVSQYTYWPDDRLDQMTYPSGRVVKYTYANAGRLSLVQNNGTTFADLFTYEDAGHLASYRTGTVTHAFTYDARQRLYTTTAGGSAGLALTYYYDDANQIRQIGDTRPGMHQVFEYDKVGRLTAADGPWGNLRWAYDAAGNRLSETLGSITSYTYNTATQRLTSISGGQAESFTYDSAGRLVSDSRGTYTYNHRGLLATVTKPGGMSPFASYGYDPSGLRTRRWVDGDTTYTIRGAGGEVLSEYRAPCGGPVWSRDVIYAVGRPLGAVRTNASQPQVAVTAATANANENQGTINVGVRVTIPGGGTLSCPVTVGYEIAPGTAARGLDYTAVGGVLTFPSGTASGTVLNIAVPIVSDAINEAWKETFTVLLSTATGAEVIAPAGQTVSIVDDELAPVMWIEQPAEGALVKTPVYMSGWAIDENAPSGPGVDLIHIYATPSGGSASFVGAGTYGDPRSYIADYFGPQFLNSGWIANVALAPGTYTLTVYARSTGHRDVQPVTDAQYHRPSARPAHERRRTGRRRHAHAAVHPGGVGDRPWLLHGYRRQPRRGLGLSESRVGRAGDPLGGGDVRRGAARRGERLRIPQLHQQRLRAAGARLGAGRLQVRRASAQHGHQHLQSVARGDGDGAGEPAHERRCARPEQRDEPDVHDRRLGDRRGGEQRHRGQHAARLGVPESGVRPIADLPRRADVRQPPGYRGVLRQPVPRVGLLPDRDPVAGDLLPLRRRVEHRHEQLQPSARRDLHGGDLESGDVGRSTRALEHGVATVWHHGVGDRSRRPAGNRHRRRCGRRARDLERGRRKLDLHRARNVGPAAGCRGLLRQSVLEQWVGHHGIRLGAGLLPNECLHAQHGVGAMDVANPLGDRAMTPPTYRRETMMTNYRSATRVLLALGISAGAMTTIASAQEPPVLREAPGVEDVRQLLIASYPELREGRVSWRVTTTATGLLVEAHRVETPFAPLPDATAALVTGTAVVDQEGHLESLLAGGTILEAVRTKAAALDQDRAVVHGDPSDHDEADTPAMLSADNLITLTATAEDGDGDTASATIDIGRNLKFEDDGPSITRNGQTAPSLVTDDTDTPNATDGPVSFAGLFTGVFGADGPKDDNDDQVADADAISLRFVACRR